MYRASIDIKYKYQDKHKKIQKIAKIKTQNLHSLHLERVKNYGTLCQLAN